jgi:hypothetical protein
MWLIRSHDLSRFILELLGIGRALGAYSEGRLYRLCITSSV